MGGGRVTISAVAVAELPAREYVSSLLTNVGDIEGDVRTSSFALRLPVEARCIERFLVRDAVLLCTTRRANCIVRELLAEALSVKELTCVAVDVACRRRSASADGEGVGAMVAVRGTGRDDETDALRTASTRGVGAMVLGATEAKIAVMAAAVLGRDGSAVVCIEVLGDEVLGIEEVSGIIVLGTAIEGTSVPLGTAVDGVLGKTVKCVFVIEIEVVEIVLVGMGIKGSAALGV